MTTITNDNIFKYCPKIFSQEILLSKENKTFLQPWTLFHTFSNMNILLWIYFFAGHTLYRVSIHSETRTWYDNNIQLLSSTLAKKCNLSLGRKKWNKYFKQRKIINEIGRGPNVYFANNEQASLAFSAFPMGTNIL